MLKESKFTEGFKKAVSKPQTKSLIASIISIIAGLIAGFIFMLIASIIKSGSNPFGGFGILLLGPFNGLNPRYEIGNLIFYMVPLIFTGLSIALAYKTGLFNIGAPGQFLMGTMGSLLVALSIDTTGNRFLGILVWILAILVGVILGVIWGSLVGVLKAIFGLNEVIASIMLNWIAANIITWVFKDSPLHNIAEGKDGYLIKTSITGNFSPTLGLGKLFSTGLTNSYIDIGIIIAILFCILIWVFMNKTTLGYEMKACGLNKFSAKYAGINEKKNIILCMAISGGLAAIGGALYHLNAGIEFKWQSAYQNLPSWGFNGIPVAFLANCDPLGIILSSMFIRYINTSGVFLPMVGYNQYFADIIIAIIIYLAGFTRFFISRIDKHAREVELKRLLEKEELKAQLDPPNDSSDENIKEEVK